MTDLDRIAAELATRRRFQTTAGNPGRLPDGTNAGEFPAAIQMHLLMRSQLKTWRLQVSTASMLAFCEEEPARLRDALLVLGGTVVGWIADLDSREPALVPATPTQRELVGVGVAGGMAG